MAVSWAVSWAASCGRFTNGRTGIAEMTLRQLAQFVMRGLVPGMTVFTTTLRKKDVDGRIKSGHDGK
jgi:hypothetical protein